MESELAKSIREARQAAADYIRAIQELEKISKPPMVQELILARRDVENARMRLGVALAYETGQDPLGSK